MDHRLPTVKREMEEILPVNRQETSEIEDTPASPTTGDASCNPWNSTKCVFCQQILTTVDSPKLMECLHAACSNCVCTKLSEQYHIDADIVENNVLVCPVCNVHCPSTNIIEHQFLMEVDAEPESSGIKPSDLKCTSCHDNSLATSWCVDCSEYICDGCVQAHQRLKITKEHTIKPKHEAEQNTSNQNSSINVSPRHMYCSVHRQERLSLFCETCDKLTCRDCQLTDHRAHKYKFIHEIAAETKELIGSLLSEVTYKRVLLTSAMKVIDDRQNSIVEKKKALMKDITQLVVKLTNSINQRGKQLFIQLNDVCDSKQRTLKEKKAALEHLSSLTDHCINFVKNAISQSSDMALLFSKRTLTNHLQRIKSRRADIPNPEIPVRINLSLDRLGDLTRALTNIGGIIVDGRLHTNVQTPAPPTSPLVSTQKTVPAQQAPPVSSQISQTNPAPQSHSSNRMSPHLPSNRTSPQQPTVQPVALARNINVPRLQSPNLSTTPIPQINGPFQMTSNNHQQQVTSSTHPQPVQSETMNPNLRGILSHHPPYAQNPMIRVSLPNQNSGHLLHYRVPNSCFPNLQPAPNIRFANQSPTQTQPMFAMQHQQLRHPHGSYSATPVVKPSNTPRVQSPQSSNQIMSSNSIVQWHIPQQSVNSVNSCSAATTSNSYQQNIRPPPPSIPIDESFKITLRHQVPQPTMQMHPVSQYPEVASRVPNGHVSSSIPKTPSPGHPKLDETGKSLDTFCQESVNDLMATIARLDRNGIEVVPEMQKGLSADTTIADSSTGLDDSVNVSNTSVEGICKLNAANDTTEPQKDDPNEDWCAVCMDGGELVCCDKCPKVFHICCHIPSLKAIPGGTFQCLLCTNVKDILEAPPTPEPDRRSKSLTNRYRKLAERILLELYCQYEPSLPFREAVSPEVKDYYEKIKNPMSLDVIRKKLDPSDLDHYVNIQDFISDVRLIFKNAYIFNQKDSQVYQDAKTLEEFFDSLLEKWLPAFAYDVSTAVGSEDELERPQKRFRRIISD